MTTRLEILGDDGEWQELPGVASFSIGNEAGPVPPDSPADEETWRRHDALDALHFAFSGQALQPLRTYIQALHHDPFYLLAMQSLTVLRTRRAFQVATRKYRARRRRSHHS